MCNWSDLVCNELSERLCPYSLKRLSSFLLTTSDYGDSRPTHNGGGSGSGLLQRDKFCVLDDPDAIGVLAMAALGGNNECEPG